MADYGHGGETQALKYIDLYTNLETLCKRNSLSEICKKLKLNLKTIENPSMKF